MTFFIVIIVIFSTNYFSKATKSYIRNESTLIYSDAIDKALEDLCSDYEIENIIYKENSSYNVSCVCFDTQKANFLAVKASNALKDYFSDLNDSKFTVSIPICYLFFRSSYLFSDKSINVKVKEIASYKVSVSPEIVEYGINSSLVALYMNIDISFNAIIPLIVENIDISKKILLSLNVINSDVPEVIVNR